MSEPSFDEQWLTGRLAKLKYHQMLAFGAACAERILSNYRLFSAEVGWGNEQPVRQALDAIWEACSGSAPDSATRKRLLADCEAAAPDSEDFDSLFTSFAQDAVFATCSLLDFLETEAVDKIVIASRYPIDSIDTYVQEMENINPQDPDLEDKILDHPLMQQELQRQSRDLREVEHLVPGDRDAAVKFKRHSQQEQAFVLTE